MASTGEMWRLGRRPALDGVRGIAILLVMLAHLRLPGFLGGGLVGVTMFFTLSGFLITTLLLEEHVDRGRVRLAAFYRRRAARLLPALVVVAAVVVLIGAAAVGDLLPVAVYVGNWVRADGGSIGYLDHTWSLAIEEQFYLVWPIVLIALAGRRRLLVGVALGGALLAVALRFALWDGGAGAGRIYYGSDTRADALLLGALTAVALHRRPARTAQGASWCLVSGIAISVVHGGFAGYVAAPLVVALLTASGVALAVQGPGPRWLRSAWLTFFGRRSYGLYLWHVPLVWFTQEFDLTPAAGFAARLVMLAAAVVLAELSWRFVEQPAQAWITGRRAPAVRRLVAQTDL